MSLDKWNHEEMGTVNTKLRIQISHLSMIIKYTTRLIPELFVHLVNMPSKDITMAFLGTPLPQNRVQFVRTNQNRINNKKKKIHNIPKCICGY